MINRYLVYIYAFLGITLVSVLSIFTMFLRKNFIGIIILIFVIVAILIFSAKKLQINLKPEDKIFAELRDRNPQLKNDFDTAEVNIDDIKNNSKLKQEILKRGYPSANRPLSYNLENENNRSKQNVIKCTKCGNFLDPKATKCKQCGTTISK